MAIEPVRGGPSHHVAGMREHKAAATTAGILYITGTVAGVLTAVVSAPVRDARDPLAAAAEHSGAVVTAALLVLVMGLSLAFVPVVLFPVLRRVDEVLAIGYLLRSRRFRARDRLVLLASLVIELLHHQSRPPAR